MNFEVRYICECWKFWRSPIKKLWITRTTSNIQIIARMI